MNKKQDNYILTNECRNVFSNMKDTIAALYHGHVVVGEHYLLAIKDTKE